MNRWLPTHLRSHLKTLFNEIKYLKPQPHGSRDCSETFSAKGKRSETVEKESEKERNSVEQVVRWCEQNDYRCGRNVCREKRIVYRGKQNACRRGQSVYRGGQIVCRGGQSVYRGK